MLNPVRQKRDLHIRAAGIFIMQLELLEIQRLVTVSHNEEPIVAEEPIFATGQRDEAGAAMAILALPFGLPRPFLRERGRMRVNFQQVEDRDQPLTSILSPSKRGEADAPMNFVYS